MTAQRRYELTDEEWERIREYVPQREAGQKGRPRNDDRQILNGILWTAIRTFTEKSSSEHCIPPKSNDRDPWDCDWWLYKERHLVECFFQKLKVFEESPHAMRNSPNGFLPVFSLVAL